MLFTIKIAGEYNVAQQNSLKLWHERLGHINVKSIKETEKARAVEGMKIENGTEFFCEACMIGKQAQKSHPSSKWERIAKPGEMIHSDVCGLLNIDLHEDQNILFCLRMITLDFEQYILCNLKMKSLIDSKNMRY